MPEKTELKKNQEIELLIESLGNNGEGIGHVDGYTLFVNGALPGERVIIRIVKLKKSYGYGRLLSVTESSKDRVEPACPVAGGLRSDRAVQGDRSFAGSCGGCDLQHMTYEKQLEFKVKRVRDCLERIGGVDFSGAKYYPIEFEIISDDRHCFNYRNKAQFPVGRNSGIAVAGFFAPRSHRIIECENCMLQDPLINKAVRIVMEWVRELEAASCTNTHENHMGAKKKTHSESSSDIIYDEEKHTGWLRHIYVRKAAASGQLMVCLVVNENRTDTDTSCGNFRASKCIDQRLLDVLKDKLTETGCVESLLLNINNKKSNVVLGDKYITVFGKKYIRDMIGDLKFNIAPESFYQVNPYTTIKLYEKALEYAALTGTENVWDLYCGIGTISLFLAGKAKHVLGIEVVEQAILNARENAGLNGIKNAEFICSAAEDIAVKISDVSSSLSDNNDRKKISIDGKTYHAPDVIVVDPPRKGCDEKLTALMGELSPAKIVYVSCDPATLARDIFRLRAYGYVLKKVCVADQFPQTRHVETVVQLVNIGVNPD